MGFRMVPSFGSTALFLAGWASGWLLLWRLRPPPSGLCERGAGRSAVSVIIPARNEAGVIAGLVEAVVSQLGPDDELVVVDDRSTDGTGTLAASAGARVIDAPDIPEGWIGKPNACWSAVGSTSAPVLLFLDADVTPGAGLVDGVVAALGIGDADDGRTALSSVQPWHAIGDRWYEQLSWPFNVTALMGSARFAAMSDRLARPKMAFGPVICCRRADYERVGGHSHPTVRAATAEDLAMARLFDRVELFSGGPSTTFRMYPGGFRSFVQGWTKIMGVGARGTRWWSTLMIAGWIASLAGGWLTSPWFYAASAIQVAVLSRRAGRFSRSASLLYPLAVALFVVVFARSVAVNVLRMPVRWKGRSVLSQ